MVWNKVRVLLYQETKKNMLVNGRMIKKMVVEFGLMTNKNMMETGQMIKKTAMEFGQ